ncbi:MAG TPA: (Fe-S)-binding protein [Burkholderiales bacterium]|nr:(Fe-S)-binding protein [Burkholderiales bacterium]
MSAATGELKRAAGTSPGFACDRQGTRSDDERVAQAMRGFVEDFGRKAALYLESCIHCGMCAESCHFYEVTGDPKYTPVWKLEPLKQAYKREYGPFAPIFRLLNLKRAVSADQLAEWQHLLYDSCTMCGRCSLMCPMGIDIAGLISDARHGMARAGLVPAELREAADRGAAPADFKDRIGRLAAEHRIDIPLDKAKADVLCTISATEIEKYPASIVATAKIMQRLGADWTFRSDGYQANNFGLLAGDAQKQKEASMKLIDAAVACGAKSLILPECGHAYGALRWMGANIYGKPLPFQVLHISEFLAENVRSGKLRLKRLDKSATFHDPCQSSRRGGVIEAPREVLAALGVELKEMFPTRGTNWCCGGGGGVVDIRRADALRHKVFHLKMNQIDDTGAELPVTSCSDCRKTFDDGQTHYRWDKSMNSLLELVADNLAEA